MYGIVSSVFLLFQMVTVYPLLLFMFRNQFMTKVLRIANYRYLLSLHVLKFLSFQFDMPCDIFPDMRGYLA